MYKYLNVTDWARCIRHVAEKRCGKLLSKDEVFIVLYLTYGKCLMNGITLFDGEKPELHFGKGLTFRLQHSFYAGGELQESIKKAFIECEYGLKCMVETIDQITSLSPENVRQYIERVSYALLCLLERKQEITSVIEVVDDEITLEFFNSNNWKIGL